MITLNSISFADIWLILQSTIIFYLWNKIEINRFYGRTQKFKNYSWIQIIGIGKIGT